MNRILIVLASTLLLLLPLKAPASDPGSPDPTMEVASADGAAMWHEFLAEADAETAFDVFDLIEEIGYDTRAVDKEACQSRRAELAEAVQRAAVSIAARHAALLCAQAMGDAPWAAREEAALEALSRLALSQVSDVYSARPIRALVALDGYALIANLGLEYSYGYYVGLAPALYMPFVIVAWDPEAQIERHFAFDSVDVSNAIVRNDTYSGFPYQRTQLVQALVEAQAKGEQIVGVDIAAAIEASQTAGIAAKVAKLRLAAEAGGIQSASLWMALCEDQPTSNCADGLVDALLPGAEARQALPMAQLAYAYAKGIGVERDESAAASLLDAADRRWPRAGASALFASYWLMRGKDDASAFLAARIDVAHKAGNRNIDNVVLLKRISADAKPLLDAPQLAHLAKPENNARGAGESLLAKYYAKNGDTAKELEWTARAAGHGDADAMADYGSRLMRGEGVAKDLDAGRKMLSDAAHGGNAFAARMLSHLSTETGDWKQAVHWLLAPMVAGNIPALLDGARIYEYERPGFEGELPRAVSIYRSLADENDVSEARRRLAAMAVAGRGMEKSVESAQAWLRKDADRGDHESEAMLGAMILHGAFGKVDEAEGRKWMERAIAANEPGAHADYGTWLFNKKATTESRLQAIEVWQRGVEADDDLAMNNFAWALCTTPQDNDRDPKRGSEIAARMGTPEDLDAGSLDTVAACRAATGDFPEAVRMQRLALRMFEEHATSLGPKAEPEMAPTLKRVRERLALYEANKPYLEPPEG
jgi:TPR repeat protein